MRIGAGVNSGGQLLGVNSGGSTQVATEDLLVPAHVRHIRCCNPSLAFVRNVFPAHPVEQSLQLPLEAMAGRFGLLGAIYTGCTELCQTWRLGCDSGAPVAYIDDTWCNRYRALRGVRIYQPWPPAAAGGGRDKRILCFITSRPPELTPPS